MRKRTLIGLKTERTAIKLVLDDLGVDLINTEDMKTRLGLHAQITRRKQRLTFLEVDITCVEREVKNLNKIYSNNVKGTK